MTTVKVMKDGNYDFAKSIKIIDEKFKLILKIKKEIDLMLSSEEWTGNAKERCEDMHKLTEIYRTNLSLQYSELGKITSNLKDNVNSFVTTSVANEL